MKKRKLGRKLLSFLLTLALVLGLMPGMSLTAYAAPTEKLLTTITATGKEQASYSTENVATVSFSYTANGYSKYTNNGTTATWGWWGYGWTATVTPADGYTITKCVFYDDKDRTATDSEAPFVVETTEEDKTPKVNGTPILANQSKGITKIEVYGYATPATVDPVPYMAWNGSTLEEKDGDNACKTYTVVTVDTTAFEDGKWYVVSDNVTVSSRITVTGTAHLILCDGATLTASKGITVNNGNTINIYAQSGGTGELSAGNDVNTAGIGGGARYQSGGTINIHGGKITANGGSYSSGIGGALDGGNGEVNIYSGEVTAQGQNFAAGIGGYSGKSGGTVNIYGGTVNASGSQYGTTGIGIGGIKPGSCVVHIYGGEVTATSEKAAAGIQGTVTIDGGTVTANGGVSDRIDDSSGETYSSNGINGTITVNGGTVTASGGNVTANSYMGAIESCGGTIYACSGISGTVTISGGTVTATGGNVTGDINNFGGTIYACNGVNGTVTISGGTVTATGGSHTGNSSGTTVKEKGFGGSLTLGTGMYLYGGTSANPESNLSNYRAGAGDYTGDRYVYMTVNNVVPHIHSFTYTADGATVTATCGAEGCDLTSNPTLTIVAPTLTTYGQTGEGISEKATLDGLDAFNSATDLTVAASDIKYYGVEEYEIEGHTYKKQGDELAQVPTAAGEYVAGLTLSNVKTSETETGDVIARVWYTIAPASISSVTVTDITAPVATEALDTEAATSTANVTLGAVTWNPTTTPAAYATQYTATVIATAAANYAFADTVTATVNGQAATVTKNDGGTLTIAYTFEKTALTPVTITATDKKADWSADGIAIPVEGMFTITEGAGAATYTVTNGTGEGTYDAQTGKLTVTKCGTFTVKVSTAATDTYAAGAETTATLTVNKVDSTAATVTANTLIYTGSAQALVTVTGEATGGTMQYALGTKDAATEEYTPSIPTGTNAGTYYVWYKVVGDGNHQDYIPTSPVTVTIEQATVKINKKAALTVTADAKNIIYGDEDVVLTYKVEGLTGSDKAEDVLTGALTREAGTDAGTYKIEQGSLTSAEYGIAFVGADYVIAKASQAAPAESFTTSKATGSDTIDGKISGFAGTKTYQISSDNGATWTDVKAGETSLVVKAGVYQIRYAGDKNHEAGASVSVTVGKKADQSKPEGLEAVNVSAEDAKDGEITGVSDTMEYSVDKGTTWKAVPANADKIDGLAAGEVLVRYAETDDKNAGSNTTVTVGVASKTEGVVEFKPEEGGTDVEEKAITGVDNESTKASVDDFAETQQEEGKDVKVALEITPQKEENVNKESVEETNKVVEEVFAGIDSEKVVTEYLAIDVAKYVDNVKETENISDTKSPLEIVLKFDSKKSNPVVVRTHDGKAKAFGKLRSRPAKKDYKDAMFYIDPENAILYIYSQYFSDFAIVYATETTYNVGFVSGTNENLSPLVVAEGGKVTLPTVPKNDGYAFDGWYKDEAYTTAWNDNDTVNSDITLYAKWNKSVSGVSVSPSEVKFTKAGETSQIKVTVTPADAANTKVTYKSSDTKVATVDANGKITAVANGTATITVTTEDGAKTATVKVTVSIPEVKQQGTEEPVQQPTKEEKAVISMNAGLKISQTGSKINIKWGKVKEADGYDVYVAYCGKKFGKAVKTINMNSTTSITVKKINGKKINLKKNFKVYVAAYKMTDGKKEVLAKSIMGHVVGRLNTRYSNAKKITLSKSKYSVKVGKTVKVKAKTVLVDKSKKQLSDGHAKEFRYATSNKNIATVDKNGKVKGVAKGNCIIYVYARNGYAKTVSVTVK